MDPFHSSAKTVHHAMQGDIQGSEQEREKWKGEADDENDDGEWESERRDRRGRRRGIGRGGVHLPRLRVDVEYIILLQIELEEATGHLGHDGFELSERNVLVVGQVEVLPRLGLLYLLAADGLRHLLLLLDNVDDVTVPIRMAVSVGAAGVEENVVNGVDALRGGGDESVLRLL